MTLDVGSADGFGGDAPAGKATPDARYEQRESIERAFVAAL